MMAYTDSSFKNLRPFATNWLYNCVDAQKKQI